ncbi:STM3941 family protein [Niabella aurantiaca]|uniref:STM3941 family protein n=1 Tax=Niabella aurantiaca TaxID=379900 RepID=UPI0003A24ED1|nr:STM3941 family protein [Niabella aurantiaca]
MMQAITIPVNKTKIVRYLIGAILFVVLGALFVLKPFLFIRSEDPTVIKIIGYICTAFFGIGIVVFVQKLRNKKDGLFIDADGITDNSSGISAGRVLWRDVKSIRLEQVADQPIIMLDVKDPLSYLQRQQNPVKKRAMELTYQLYKTPVAVSAQFLNTGAEELLRLLENAFKEFRGQ